MQVHSPEFEALIQGSKLSTSGARMGRRLALWRASWSPGARGLSAPIAAESARRAKGAAHRLSPSLTGPIDLVFDRRVWFAGIDMVLWIFSTVDALSGVTVDRI